MTRIREVGRLEETGTVRREDGESLDVSFALHVTQEMRDASAGGKELELEGLCDTRGTFESPRGEFADGEILVLRTASEVDLEVQIVSSIDDSFRLTKSGLKSFREHYDQ